jgi:hypothetical protein
MANVQMFNDDIYVVLLLGYLLYGIGLPKIMGRKKAKYMDEETLKTPNRMPQILLTGQLL